MTQTKPIDPADIARAICPSGPCECQYACLCDTPKEDAIRVLEVLRAAGVEIVGDAP
jgi:hypothetical protein